MLIAVILKRCFICLDVVSISVQSHHPCKLLHWIFYANLRKAFSQIQFFCSSLCNLDQNPHVPKYTNVNAALRKPISYWAVNLTSFSFQTQGGMMEMYIKASFFQQEGCSFLHENSKECKVEGIAVFADNCFSNKK